MHGVNTVCLELHLHLFLATTFGVTHYLSFTDGQTEDQ